jgi:hypothetical protein
MAGGDVIEDQLVRAVVLVSAGLLHRIARVDMIEKLDAFDHAAAVNVEAWNDPASEHGVWVWMKNEGGRM